MVILIVYLVVASSRGPKMPAAAQPVMVACVDSDRGGAELLAGAAASAATAIPAADLRAPLAPMEAVPQS